MFCVVPEENSLGVLGLVPTLPVVGGSCEKPGVCIQT